MRPRMIEHGNEFRGQIPGQLGCHDVRQPIQRDGDVIGP